MNLCYLLAPSHCSLALVYTPLNHSSVMTPTCFPTVLLLFSSYLPIFVFLSLATHMLFISPRVKAMKLGVLKFCISFHDRRHHSNAVHPILASASTAPVSPMNSLRTTKTSCHGVATRAREALQVLIKSSRLQLPETFIDYTNNIKFLHGSAGDVVCFPCPLQEQEAASALKALEGAAVAAIADLIENRTTGRSIEVHLDRVTCFLMSAYMVTINDKGKLDPGVQELVRGSLLPPPQADFVARVANRLERYRY